jgi:putative methyltransferase (TIGR04325 family)
MTALSLLQSFKEVPGVVALRRRRYERFFATATDANLFRGVYRDFAEAEATAPHTKDLGYDHPEPAAMYRERAEHLHPSDYPVLFWLLKHGQQVKRVFDFGGHVGVSFYAYQHYLSFPSELKWTVCDVPAVVEAGAVFAHERGAKQLQFTTNRNDGSGADLWLANGSLQYLEEPLHRLLSALQERPKRVIANMLPVAEGESFVTLQNIGTAFCPYRIHHRASVIEGVCALGYRLVDSWVNPEKSCHVPFAGRHHVDA